MKKSLLALSVAVGISLTGCGGKDPQELIQSAQQNLQQGDEAAAVIELKTVLQEDPRNTQARFMLGKLYSDNGGAVAATKELFTALEGGYDINAVTTELAPMLYLQSDTSGFDQLLERKDELNNTAKSLLIAYDGLTSLELGELERATESLQEASDIEENQYTKLLNGYLLFSDGNLEEATKLANELVAESSAFAESRFLLGQLALIQNDTDLAVAEFKAYHEQMPENFRGTVFLANALVKNKDFEEAGKLVDQLLSVSAEQPFLNFLKSVVSFQNKDFKAANLHSVKAIQNGYTQDTARVIAGLSAFLLDKNEQAYDQLVPLKDKFDPNNPVMKLLSHLSLQLGYLDTVDDIMSKDGGLSDDEIIVLSKVTADLVTKGELERGRKLSNRLKSAQPNSELAMISKGFAQLTIGDLEGVETLEELLSQSPGSNIANSALAQAYLDNGLLEEATALAKEWQEAKPEGAAGYLLEALVLTKQGNMQQANSLFEEVLALDPANPTANLYLAKHHYENGELAEAKAQLKATLQDHPAHISTLANFFAIHKESGTADEGLSQIKAAFDESDKSVEQLNELYLVSLYDMKRWQDVISLAESLNTETLTTYSNVVWGNSYYRLGNPSESIKLVEDWIKREPDNAVANLRLISLLELDGQLGKSLEAARAAASAFDENIFYAVASDLAIKANRIEVASSLFKKLSDDYKKSRQGNVLQAKLLLAGGQVDRAIAIVEPVHNEAKSDATVWLLAKAYIQKDDNKKAFDLYQSYLGEEEESTKLWEQFAEIAIRNRDYSKAVEAYERVLSLGEKSAKVHNNLAFLLMEQGKLDSAHSHSVNAIELEPEVPNFLDTHASILWRQGKLDEAISVYEKLYAKQPDNKAVIEKFSQLLLEAGQTEKSEAVRSTL